LKSEPCALPATVLAMNLKKALFRAFKAHLHRRIAHYLFDARLVHRELRQMLFSRCMRYRHMSKLLLHPLKDTARP
jgi:hypothetical protein